MFGLGQKASLDSFLFWLLVFFLYRTSFLNKNIDIFQELDFLTMFYKFCSRLPAFWKKHLTSYIYLKHRHGIKTNALDFILSCLRIFSISCEKSYQRNMAF